jgi:hypothetical protein
MDRLYALKPGHTPRQPVADRAAIQRTSQELFNLIAIVGIAAPAAIPWACAIIVAIGSLLAAGLRLVGRFPGGGRYESVNHHIEQVADGPVELARADQHALQQHMRGIGNGIRVGLFRYSR